MSTKKSFTKQMIRKGYCPVGKIFCEKFRHDWQGEFYCKVRFGNDVWLKDFEVCPIPSKQEEMKKEK